MLLHSGGAYLTAMDRAVRRGQTGQMLVNDPNEALARQLATALQRAGPALEAASAASANAARSPHQVARPRQQTDSRPRVPPPHELAPVLFTYGPNWPTAFVSAPQDDDPRDHAAFTTSAFRCSRTDEGNAAKHVMTTIGTEVVQTPLARARKQTLNV